MSARVATFRITPGTLDALRQRYYTECAPLVKAADGSIDCLVLEPVDEQDPVAVCTVWRTEPTPRHTRQAGRPPRSPAGCGSSSSDPPISTRTGYSNG